MLSWLKITLFSDDPLGSLDCGQGQLRVQDVAVHPAYKLKKEMLLPISTPKKVNLMLIPIFSRFGKGMV